MTEARALNQLTLLGPDRSDDLAPLEGRAGDLKVLVTYNGKTTVGTLNRLLAGEEQVPVEDLGMSYVVCGGK